jgi:hypothetical protein
MKGYMLRVLKRNIIRGMTKGKLRLTKEIKGKES